MTDEESLARRICFQAGGFDPDELTANDVPRWRRYGEVARAALDWMQERSARTPQEHVPLQGKAVGDEAQ